MPLAANGPQIFVEPVERLLDGGGGVGLHLLDGDSRARDKGALLVGYAAGGALGQCGEKMQYDEEEQEDRAGHGGMVAQRKVRIGAAGRA